MCNGCCCCEIIKCLNCGANVYAKDYEKHSTEGPCMSASGKSIGNLKEKDLK